MNNELELVRVPFERNAETEKNFALVAEGCKHEVRPVDTKDDYDFVAELIKQLKTAVDDVTAYYANAKKAAHDLHKAICDEEASYTKPIKAYIDGLKKAMAEYVRLQEEKRRKEEEEMRAAALAEAERIMNKAGEVEANGGDASALIDEAIMTEVVGQSISLGKVDVRADGVARKKDWEIVEVCDVEVPTEIAGVCIRPVDTAAVMKLIRASKGTIKIPGIKFVEKETIVVRR